MKSIKFNNFQLFLRPKIISFNIYHSLTLFWISSFWTVGDAIVSCSNSSYLGHDIPILMTYVQDVQIWLIECKLINVQQQNISIDIIIWTHHYCQSRVAKSITAVLKAFGIWAGRDHHCLCKNEGKTADIFIKLANIWIGWIDCRILADDQI